MSNAEHMENGISRRGFLAGAALGTMGLVASGMLSGCASGDSGAAQEGAAAADANIEYEVYEADVLIVGTGNGALAAAWQALKEGRHVTLIDKATYKKAGASSWSWGCYSSNEMPTEVLDLTEYLVDMPAWKNVMEFWNKTYDPAEVDNSVYQVNHGQCFFDRQENGKLNDMEVPGWYGFQYFRREMDQLETMSNCSIYDNTMITNLLVNDGKCLGVVGIHIPTGKFRIFRAKATVNASGAAQWIYGWMGTGAVTMGGTDHTGDMMGIAYRQGLPMGDFEFACFDYHVVPLRASYGTAIGADIIQATAFLDNKGELLISAEDMLKLASASDLALMIAQAAYEGRCNQYNAPNWDVPESILEKREFASAYNWYKENLGIDLFAQTNEMVAEMFEKLGGAVVDENLMTELEGYFDSRGASTIGTRPDFPPISVTIRQYGHYAGHAAAEYAKNAEYPTEIDYTPAIDEFKRLTEMRTRETDAPVYPHVIRENIQKRFFDEMGLLRTTEGLEGYLAEIERIRTEDIPNQCIRDHSPNWNKEWKEAIENLNLLDVAEMSVRSTLYREETRYEYLRPEFPEKSDDWKCTVVMRNTGDTVEISKKEIRTL